ncbi:UNVERIFIED_CONTAM: hypothetical protein GTU68_025556 [Idotea baltica]|nr:hypothetical protein [Idotea baltica]
MIADGAVAIDGVAATDAKARVAEGAEVVLTVDAPEESHIGPEDIALDVVHEDDDLIVVNKPSGMVVHPAPGTPSGTLVNALLHHCGDDLSGVGGVKRPGIVHRIDKDTSGLLVVAKSDVAHQGLAAQFAAHSVERYYRAGAAFEPGNILRLTTQLARHKTDRQKQAVLFQGGRHAITRVRIVEPFGSPSVAALVECWLETGRTHQIRVHLAHAGHGLIGDPVYGAAEAVRAFSRQALHAAVLGFVHPVTGESVRFEAEVPADMSSLINALRVQSG